MSDWEGMYQAGETHWDKGEPSPGLVDWLARNKGDFSGTVLVPGCGFGHDVRAWGEAGFDVTGMDVAPSAVEGAKGKTPAGLSNVRFELGNFFDGPTGGRQFDILFEHTFFCAIDPSMRGDYVMRLLEWLKPGGHFLAVHYLLPKDEDGPPFGTDCGEVRERFSPHLELVAEWDPPTWEHRNGLERMFLWRKPG
jgi:cyclopropane fatty-acyl-phospholipid synthase-like methyltransferase